MSVEKQVDEIAAIGIDKDEDMVEDVIANRDDGNEPAAEGSTEQTTIAQTGSAGSGSARASADEESKHGDDTSAESGGAAADNARAAKETKNYHIIDYPGYEGLKMSLERAVKLKFSRLGAKAAERMRRVMNKWKAGTRGGSAAEPVDLESERAAGVHAHTDPLLLIANCDAGITCVVIVPVSFSIGNESSLLAISLKELRDPRAMVDANIMVPSVDDGELSMVFGKHRFFAHVSVPAVACFTLNPEVVKDSAGRSMWRLSIEELEILLDLKGPSCSTPPSLPASGTGHVPYVDDRGNELFVLAGTEDSTPDLTRSSKSKVASQDVICDICGIAMKPGADARHHIGAHLLFDDQWTQRPTFPCGLCGMRPVVPYTDSASLVSGCPTALVRKGSTFNHKGACKLAGEPKYNHKSALSSVEGSPCTNVPMLCPLCPQKPGVAVYKYDMEKHWRAGHSEATITPAMKESVAISAAERRWLKGRWEKAKAAAQRIAARGK